ncbi:hypothetical protein GDO81_030151, partial [Engystomops pustulosus]
FREFLEDGFWVLPTSWNQISTGFFYRESLPKKLECFSEEFCDECIVNLLGNRNENKESCVVTAACIKKMTEEGCTEYSLSHQLLYFIVGKLHRCSITLKKLNEIMLNCRTLCY